MCKSIIPMIVVALITSMGCSTHHEHVCAENQFFPRCHHKVDDTAGIVDVGGLVYRPSQLKVGDDGLTLHQALMSAGGSRELALVQETTSIPYTGAKLRELAALARTLGKLKKHADVLEWHSQTAAFIPEVKSQLTDANAQPTKAQITEAKEKLKKANNKYKEHIMSLLDELSYSFERDTLELLRDASESAGEYKEGLELLGIPEFRKKIDPKEWNQNNDERLYKQWIEGEAQLMEKLLDLRGKTSLRTLQTDLLVALERPSAEPPVTYYFPYYLATAGMASEIALRDGDSVSVVDARDTALHPPGVGHPSVKNNVSIQGYVEDPGITDGLPTISSVHHRNTPTIDDPRSVWTLVRTKATGGSQMVFVLPDRLVGSNGAAADAPTQEGDVYTYTILPQVPIVFETLLARTLETEKHQCLKRLRAMKQEHKKKKHRLLDCVRNGLSAALKPALNLLPIR